MNEDIIVDMRDRVDALMAGATDDNSPMVQQLHEELATGLEELKVVNDELSVKSAQLNDLLEVSQRERQWDGEPAPAYLETNLNGVISYLNGHAREVLAISPRVKSRKLLVSFVVPDHRHRFRSHLSAFQGNRDDVAFTVDVCGNDGVVLTIEMSAVKSIRGHEQLVQWRLRDLGLQSERDQRFVELYEQLDLARTTADLSLMLMSDRDAFDEMLFRVVSMATFVTGAAMTNISLTNNRNRDVNDNAILAELAAVQTEHCAGPAWEAHTNGQLVMVDDLSMDTRWPFLRPLAVRHAVHPVVAVPVRLKGKAMGVLTVYGRHPDMFTASDIEILHGIALNAAHASTNAHLFRTAADLADSMAESIQNRAVIEQAKGMIMLRQRCDEGEAFELLKTLSQRHNVKVRELALRIVAGESAPESAAID